MHIRFFSLAFFLLFLLGSCGGAEADQKETADQDHHPEIEIPGLGVDHRYVADELIKEGINYRRIYEIEEKDEIRDIITKLNHIERPLDTREDTMVVFSILAIKGTLYSRLADEQNNYLDDVEESLLQAINLVENEDDFKIDMAFEKLALAGTLFMQGRLQEATRITQTLVEDYQDASIPGQEMYISRSSLVTYYQMMNNVAGINRDRSLMEESEQYLLTIAEQNDNALGVEANQLLFRHYSMLDEHDKAEEILKVIDEQKKELDNS